MSVFEQSYQVFRLADVQKPMSHFELVLVAVRGIRTYPGEAVGPGLRYQDTH